MKLSMRREQSTIVIKTPKVKIKSCTGVRRGNIVFFTLVINIRLNCFVKQEQIQSKPALHVIAFVSGVPSPSAFLWQELTASLQSK